MSEEREIPLETYEEEGLDLEDESDLEDEDETEGEDDGPDEAEDAAPPEPPAPQRKPQSREARRVQSLRNRLKEKEEENRQLIARISQPAPQPQPPDPYRQAEEARLEAERVQMMAPHEVAAYYSRKSEERISQQLLRSRIETGDLLDRNAFQQLQRDEPAARRLAAEVENTLIAARREGMNPTREAVYELLVGREVRSKSRRDTEKQRRNGQRNISRQTTRPGSARSTATSTRRRGEPDMSDAAVEARLKSVTIGDW